MEKIPHDLYEAIGSAQAENGRKLTQRSKWMKKDGGK